MFINLADWRSGGLQEAFIKYIQRQNGKVYFEDQGLLNMVLRGKIGKLPLKYNVITSYFIYGSEGTRISCGCELPYSKAEMHEAMVHPAIVHFTNCYVAAGYTLGRRQPSPLRG